MTERDILTLLEKQYAYKAGWITFEKIRSTTGYAADSPRYIDFFAINAWPSTGFKRIAYEIKCSASDFYAEFRNPWKRAAGFMLSDEFYFVLAPDCWKTDGVKKQYRAMEGSGIIEVTEDNRLRMAYPASNRMAWPMPIQFTAAILRAAYKITQEDSASRYDADPHHDLPYPGRFDFIAGTP